MSLRLFQRAALALVITAAMSCAADVGAMEPSGNGGFTDVDGDTVDGGIPSDSIDSGSTDAGEEAEEQTTEILDVGFRSHSDIHSLSHGDCEYQYRQFNSNNNGNSEARIISADGCTATIRAAGFPFDGQTIEDLQLGPLVDVTTAWSSSTAPNTNLLGSQLTVCEMDACTQYNISALQ